MQTRSMQAAVLVAPGRLELREVARPDPQRHQVRVRLEGCGVCASNLAMWEGMPWSQYPTVPGSLGHEGWGRVDAVGAEVKGIREGDRVALLAGNSYAEYDVAPAVSAVLLPPSLGSIPFPGEAIGCGINIFERSRIAEKQTVAIVGIGFLGAILTRLAVHIGARVIAVSRRPFALQIAQQMGAAELIPMDDHRGIIDRVRELTGGRMCDCVIEAVGKQWPLDLAAELTAVRARLVIAGYHQDGPRQVNMQMWNWRGLDVVNAHERDERIYLRAMRRAVDAVQSGLLDPRELCTHSFPLRRLGDAFDAARQRPEGFLKAMVTYD